MRKPTESFTLDEKLHIGYDLAGLTTHGLANLHVVLDRCLDQFRVVRHTEARSVIGSVQSMKSPLFTKGLVSRHDALIAVSSRDNLRIKLYCGLFQDSPYLVSNRVVAIRSRFRRSARCRHGRWTSRARFSRSA